MKLYIQITADFDNAEIKTKELEFSGLKDGATLIDCPQGPISSAVKELSSLGMMRGYAVALVGSSTAD